MSNQPQYGQPQYGQPQYGQPQYPQAPYVHLPYGPPVPPPGPGPAMKVFRAVVSALFGTACVLLGALSLLSAVAAAVVASPEEPGRVLTVVMSVPQAREFMAEESVADLEADLDVSHEALGPQVRRSLVGAVVATLAREDVRRGAPALAGDEAGAMRYLHEVFAPALRAEARGVSNEVGRAAELLLSDMEDDPAQGTAALEDADTGATDDVGVPSGVARTWRIAGVVAAAALLLAAACAGGIAVAVARHHAATALGLAAAVLFAATGLLNTDMLWSGWSPGWWQAAAGAASGIGLVAGPALGWALLAVGLVPFMALVWRLARSQFSLEVR